MGFFYVDESIHERGDFILVAFVYSSLDLTPIVFEEVRSVGLIPGTDEFKSSSRMDSDEKQKKLRSKLKGLLKHIKLGLAIIPYANRDVLGKEILFGLRKIIFANYLDNIAHHVFLDDGIAFNNREIEIKNSGLSSICDFHVGQDSRAVGGIQMADLAAHTMSVMLLEKLGLVTKTVKAGPSSGYDPDLDIGIGFEMWATLRYNFFTQDNINLNDFDPITSRTLDTGTYALYISGDCSPEVKSAAEGRFSENYLGCIH